MYTVISHFDLRPGQWVVFTHYKEEIPKELQGPFKVINRNDAMFDTCRCFLMDVEGTLVDYCPRMTTLGGKELPWRYNVHVLSNECIVQELGEKIEKVQEREIEHLKRLAQLKNLGKSFDPEDSSKTLNGAQIRGKYGLTLKS